MSIEMDSTTYWFILGVEDRAYEAAYEQTSRTPNNAEVWFKRGLIELRQMNHRAAHASLIHAVRLDSGLMEAWALLCLLWAEADKPLAALITAQRTLEHRPDLAPLIAQTAFALAEHGAIFEALDTLESVTATGYTPARLSRLHARLLGACGFSQHAYQALRAIWQASDQQER